MKLWSFALFLCVGIMASRAETTINAANRHAYGANIGWVNARGDVANGVVVGQTFCRGYAYTPSIGWVCMGNGPTNGLQYSNTAPDDYGVNVDEVGNLRGYAWSANVGWVRFEANGAPRVDRATGVLNGHAYGANVGWIGFSTAFAYVQTQPLVARGTLFIFR